MSVGLRRQRVDEAKLVGALGQVRQQIGNVLARLTSRPEFPGALGQVAVFALKSDQFVDPRHRLTVPLPELGFVVPGIEMAYGTRAEDVQDTLGSGRKVRRLRSKRVNRLMDFRAVWLCLRPGTVFRGQESIASQQCASGQSPAFPLQDCDRKSRRSRRWRARSIGD